jgi:hypothetical protein
LLELTKVKVSHLTEDALRAQDEAYLASLPKPKLTPTAVPQEPEKPKLPKLSKEEEVLRDKWLRLLDMVSKGRLEPLKTFWDREVHSIGSINAQIPEWAEEKRATLLQVAAHVGHEDVVCWLLEEAHADPTIPVPQTKNGELEEENDSHQSDTGDRIALPEYRRMAYDLARTKGVRDIFRRCAASHPDWWDWFGAGHVPSGLSKQMEDDREEKKKMRRKGLKDRVKERGAKEREKEKEQPSLILPVEDLSTQQKQQSLSSSNRLGGRAGAGEGIAGLTPEMRAKVERERRARAAESRLKALGAK